ncbi:MAG: hypothetical protein O7F17_05295 [Planctomycetota bacterium]|nr:hypothetical protein [Planctomycetota bacterium]
MSPEKRSVLLAMVGGMMAAAYLDVEGIVDLSFGFPRGGVVAGAIMAITGAAAGCATILSFRKLRDLVTRSKT